MPIKTDGKVYLSVRISESAQSQPRRPRQTVNTDFNRSMWIKQRILNCVVYRISLSPFLHCSNMLCALRSLWGMRITWMNNVSVYTFYLQGFGALKICQYTEQSEQQLHKAHNLCLQLTCLPKTWGLLHVEAEGICFRVDHLFFHCFKNIFTTELYKFTLNLLIYN